MSSAASPSAPLVAPLARLIGDAFGGAADLPAVPRPVGSASRRRKLWELPGRWLCPLIGTCLPVAELRRLAARAGFDDPALSDYSLHTLAVGQCDHRSPLAEAIQRAFDKRFAATLARFAKAADGAAVLFAWRAALAGGDDLAAALWAAWTHPALGEDDGREIFGDLHMLSHQVGASARADLAELERLRRDNARLREDIAALRRGLEQAQRERVQAVDALRGQLVDAEQRAALLPYRELELAEARRAAERQRGTLARAQALAERAERLEERNADLARRTAAATRELNETRDALAASEAALEIALGACTGVQGEAACGRSCPAEAALTGRCVLCIGGRTGSVDGYRRLVELRGGRFLHHDGGQEENLHRLDAAIAAADAVVCQAGCVSHAAYFRLKDACKKLGKPCVFVKSPGVGSFARGLAALGGAANGERHVAFLSH